MSRAPELIDYSSALSGDPIARELYNVQVEMLDPGKGFAGLVVSSEVSESLTTYDTKAKNITVYRTGTDKPLTQILSHEMTHAIDDLYNSRVEKNLEMLVRDLRDDDTMAVKRFVSSALPDDMRGEYRRQANTKALFTQETGAYIFEGIFKDMKEGKFTDILSRFEEMTPTGARREAAEKGIAQELVAVAIGSISDAMITHMESSRGAGLSPERASLLEKLTTLNAVVSPVRERANEKLAKIEAGYRDVEALDPSRKRQMIEDGIESSILARESELHKSPADRMRVALTRAETESEGKEKYGDLKRTISPIRMRPANGLG